MHFIRSASLNYLKYGQAGYLMSLAVTMTALMIIRSNILAISVFADIETVGQCDESYSAVEFTAHAACEPIGLLPRLIMAAHDKDRYHGS